MLNLAMRNCRVFLRDRISVFFSFLAVFIIIGLYVLFLGDMMKQSVRDVAGGALMMDRWIMAGMVAASTFTATLGSLGTMVEDRAWGIRKDFRASPLKRSAIAGGYLISAMLLGLLLCVVTFALSEGYVLLNGGHLLPFAQAMQVLGVLTLSVLASSAMLFFVVSFLKTNSAFGGLSTIAGTFIGFLTGIYVPIGALPAPVQAVVKCFPTSHAAVLLRRIMMAGPMREAFTGAPASVVLDFELELGVAFQYGQMVAGNWLHIAVLVATILVFFGLSVWRVSKAPDE